jgi:alkylation response protein AidB-like acyl-CoA dehydrogenase
LKIAGLGMNGYGCPGGSRLLGGLVAMELARTDASFATFFGVHSGLAMNSIYLNGTEEQKQKWLPPMARGEKIGCFALTEPLVGSGAGGGLLTTAKREGDTWVLNGQKRWIGNAPWCDISIVLYVGAGAVYAIILDDDDRAVSDLVVLNNFSFALQGGIERSIANNLELFVDFKQAWLTVDARRRRDLDTCRMINVPSASLEC